MLKIVRDIIESNDTIKPNSKEMEVLREYFPACFATDGTFDIERFKEYLSDKIDVTNDGYELRFLGKNYAKLLASIETTTVIVPDEEHNNKPENAKSQNIYISGDNLDGLKHLLKSYHQKIKCIYIDPPYNTGSDGFVYNDSFNFTVEELADKLSISDEKAKRILDLTKRGSASHSAWLTFMYSRLILARDLLSKDGVIFISIDENEHNNLQLLCNDVFGEENSVGEIIWKNSSKNDQGYISIQHEYILCYVRNKIYNFGDWKERKEGIDEIFKAFEKFHKEYGNDWKAIHTAALEWYKQFPESNPISDSKHYNWMDERGVYFPDNISGPNFGQYVYDVIHPITGKVCKMPASGWRFPKSTLEEKIKDGLIHFGDDETTVPNKKTYLKETSFQSIGSIKYRDGRVASKKLTALMGVNCFTNPKDVDLLYDLFNAIKIKNQDIVLDFFSGSGTTAEVVMNFIAKKISAHFILIQQQESIDELLRKANGSGKQVLVNAANICDSLGVSRTIDQIGIERIKRAANKIREENPDTTADLGFRHFTLAEPSMETLDKLEKFEPEKELFLKNNLLNDFGVSTVLITWLVRDGYGFTAPFEAMDFAGYIGYYIEKHLYLINPKLSNEAVAAIMKKYETEGTFNPENVILFGYSFLWTEIESLKINLARLKDTEKNLRINFSIRY